ncbi:hypothetical protein [Staphylococcus casei]|uniref:DUF4868 domain-containing protein n=1 Tax=Staphylococcus casei TaxID=201828 RepID=A0ABZ2WFF5_9STAP
MTVERIYVCTSKNSKLNRIYLLQTGDEEKEKIYNIFKEDLNIKMNTEKEMSQLERQSLIEDLPYYVDLNTIDEESYLYEFKGKINELTTTDSIKVVEFKKQMLGSGEIINFEEKEGIKFLIIQEKDSMNFLSISNNAVLKNQSILTLSINENSTLTEVPKGVQIPPAVTARLDLKKERLFVYDVNRFEQMLTLNENRKAKSKATIRKFQDGTFKVSKDEYTIVGLDNDKIEQQLLESARSMRRLSKYIHENDNYEIAKVKQAVNKLDEDKRVSFDDNKKQIHISTDSAKTFVGIIYNSIVERLISGEIEVTI